MPRTSSGGGRAAGRASWIGRARDRRGHGCVIVSNKTSVDLENMPDRRVPSRTMDLLAVLKALGDETRFSMYRELAALDRGAVRAGARRPARPPRQHRAPPPRAAARGRPRRRRSRPPRHRRPPPAPLLPRRRRARARLRPAELHAARRAARRAGRARRRRRRRRGRRSGRSWGADAGRRTRSRSCVKALIGELDRLGFDPASTDDDGRRSRHRLPALPVPRAGRGLPRAGLQPAPRPLRRRRRRRSAGEASTSSRRCTTPTRAASRSRSGILKTPEFPVRRHIA